MFPTLINRICNRYRYHTHPEALLVACFFNPQRSPYRLLAFHHWYRSIKHMPHQILECTIGEDTTRQLPASAFISHVHVPQLLWHKETLLNKLIATLPRQYRYVFWVDTDVLFTNPQWLTQSVAQLQADATIVQPFEFAVHLRRHQMQPNFAVEHWPAGVVPTNRHPRVWRSFAATYAQHAALAAETNYDRHGHVGFAWGIRREILDTHLLYDKALIGGADHIMAHAAAGHIPHPCIDAAFPQQLPDILQWSSAFYASVRGRISYAPGDLYHLWHGALRKRQYFSRIHAFDHAHRDVFRDAEGFWVDPTEDTYVEQYFEEREAEGVADYQGYDASFEHDMGYPLEALCPPLPLDTTDSMIDQTPGVWDGPPDPVPLREDALSDGTMGSTFS